MKFKFQRVDSNGPESKKVVYNGIVWYHFLSSRFAIEKIRTEEVALFISLPDGKTWAVYSSAIFLDEVMGYKLYSSKYAELYRNGLGLFFHLQFLTICHVNNFQFY